MLRCRTCRKRLRGERDDLGARCPHCRAPLFEPPHADDEPAPDGAHCAAHAANAAYATCQRCGNYVCDLCRSRWRDKWLCVGCVEHALAANEAAPEDIRTHLRQAVLSVLCGVASWSATLAALVLIVAALGDGADEPNVALAGLGGLLFLASPMPALVGVGQGAAAVRARGDHLILATAGLILSGLQTGVVVGLFLFSAWQN